MTKRFNIQVVVDEDLLRSSANNYDLNEPISALIAQDGIRNGNGVIIEKIEEIRDIRVFDTNYGKYYVKQISDDVCGVYNVHDDCKAFNIFCNENDEYNKILVLIESYFDYTCRIK